VTFRQIILYLTKLIKQVPFRCRNPKESNQSVSLLKSRAKPFHFNDCSNFAEKSVIFYLAAEKDRY